VERLDVVTGAFSYSGRYLARQLLERGHRVRTLTNNPAARNGEIDVRPLQFHDPSGLVDALRGVSTLYNTYWVRFAHGNANYERAVANTRALFAAARTADVERVVHVSITRADESSLLP
jgi:NADH dehydrogenase